MHSPFIASKSEKSDSELELLSIPLLSAMSTLLVVHTCDPAGHMIKFEAFEADDLLSCIYYSFSSEKMLKEAFKVPHFCFNVLPEVFR